MKNGTPAKLSPYEIYLWRETGRLSASLTAGSVSLNQRASDPPVMAPCLSAISRCQRYPGLRRLRPSDFEKEGGKKKNRNPPQYVQFSKPNYLQLEVKQIKTSVCVYVCVRETCSKKRKEQKPWLPKHLGNSLFHP